MTALENQSHNFRLSYSLYSLLQKVPMDAGFRITTVVFFTPDGEKVMTVNDAHKKGYWIGNSPTRLVQRVPSTAPETFTHNVGTYCLNNSKVTWWKVSFCLYRLQEFQ